MYMTEKWVAQHPPDKGVLAVRTSTPNSTPGSISISNVFRYRILSIAKYGFSLTPKSVPRWAQQRVGREKHFFPTRKPWYIFLKPPILTSKLRLQCRKLRWLGNLQRKSLTGCAVMYTWPAFCRGCILNNIAASALRVRERNTNVGYMQYY